MKKQLITIYRIYRLIENVLEPINVTLEGFGTKSIFKTEDEAKNALISNIDKRYKNGEYLVLPSYEIRYSDD